MTKRQIKEWIKTAKFVVTDWNECDSDSNFWARDIFEKDGKYYAVESINGEMIGRIEVDKDGKAIHKKNFKPTPVSAKEVNFTRYKRDGKRST